MSLTNKEQPVAYPIADGNLPFADYISRTRSIIEERRQDLSTAGEAASRIIDANSPFELAPENPVTRNGKVEYGALLLHGLLDCPFSVRDVGRTLQAQGIMSRSILLPGHGTHPADLLQVSYHAWIQAMRYGIETLRKEVNQIYLVGYSTGATLSVYQALQDAQIAGIVLLSPAIKIKAPVDIAVAWHKFTHLLSRESHPWMYLEKETDYAKYKSIPFNAVTQVAELTRVIRELNGQHPLACPVYMAVSREDETISSHQAIDFFMNQRHPDSRLLLYTSIDHSYPDPRIVTRPGNFPEKHIRHCSHVSIPFSPDNPHYGMNGDYVNASRAGSSDSVYGAYNRIEQRFFDFLYVMGLISRRRGELTYNPDFDFMAKDIAAFIKRA